MSSAQSHAQRHAQSPAEPVRPVDPDQTGRSRIRDAAVVLFGERGYEATTMRAIADRADVSAALVVHHFGSKQGLREAVDDHVSALIREGKFAAMTGSMVPSGDEYAELAAEYLPVMTYLTRALAEDDDVGQRLYDRLWSDARGYVAAGVEAGVLQPTDDPDARAAVLLNVGLAQTLLLPHLQRVLGLTDPAAAAVRMAPVMLDLYIDGLFTDDRFRVAWRSEPDSSSDQCGTKAAP